MTGAIASSSGKGTNHLICGSDSQLMGGWALGVEAGLRQYHTRHSPNGLSCGRGGSRAIEVRALYPDILGLSLQLRHRRGGIYRDLHLAGTANADRGGAVAPPTSGGPRPSPQRLAPPP